MLEQPLNNENNLPEVPNLELLENSERVLASEQEAEERLFALLAREYPGENRPRSEELENLLVRHEATSFAVKGERQQEGGGWKVGEKVGAGFIISDARDKDGFIDKSKIVLLVGGIDIRHSDKFVIDVTPEEYEAAQQYKGLTFNGVVEVTSEGKYEVSDMFAYDAKLVALESSLSVNPDNINALKNGEIVIVEGEVVNFRVTEYWGHLSEGEKEPHPKSAIITIRTPDGRLIDVNIDPNVKFEQSSKLENVNGKIPEVGDVVRINSTVVSDRRPERIALLGYEPVQGSETRDLQTYHNESEKSNTLSAPWCRSTYLLQPSAKRQQEYSALREKVQGKLTELETSLSAGSFPEVRSLFAQIVKEEVTADEREKLKDFVSSIPEVERPLMNWSRQEVDEVNSLFGVDVDQMTSRQFYEFAKKVASEIYANIPDMGQGDHSYIYRIMDNIDMSDEQREEIMSLAADVRIRYFAELEEKGLGYDHKRDWSDKYMAEHSLNHLAYLKTPSAARSLIDLCHEILATESRGRAILKDVLGYEAASSLRTLYYHSQDNPEILAVLGDSLERLKEMEKQLITEQVASPETTESRIIFVNTGRKGLGGLLGRKKSSDVKFEMSAAAPVHHKYSGPLNTLREVIGKLDPFLLGTKNGDFGENIERRVENLASGNEFFRQALATYRQKGYKFVLYDPFDPAIPEDVHRLMHGGTGAATTKENKTVYFDLDALSNYAFRQGKTTEYQLTQALIDESVHMMSDLTFDYLSPSQTEAELKFLKGNPEPTTTERKMFEVIKEEILADMISRVVLRQLENADYKLPLEDLNPSSEFEGSTLQEVKAKLSILVLGRIYNVDLMTLPESDQNLLLGRLAKFIASGEIENYLITQLRKLDLLGEQK